MGFIDFENQVPPLLLDLSCFSGLVRLRFMGKITQEDYEAYLSDYRHFDFNDLISGIRSEMFQYSEENPEELCKNMLQIVYTPRLDQNFDAS